MLSFKIDCAAVVAGENKAAFAGKAINGAGAAFMNLNMSQNGFRSPSLVATRARFRVVCGRILARSLQH